MSYYERKIEKYELASDDEFVSLLFDFEEEDAKYKGFALSFTDGRIYVIPSEPQKLYAVTNDLHSIDYKGSYYLPVELFADWNAWTPEELREFSETVTSAVRILNENRSIPHFPAGLVNGMTPGFRPEYMAMAEKLKKEMEERMGLNNEETKK
jgi:hypothetical protein